MCYVKVGRKYEKAKKQSKKAKKETTKAKQLLQEVSTMGWRIDEWSNKEHHGG